MLIYLGVRTLEWCDIRQETTEGENGESRIYYTYTEIRFERWESNIWNLYKALGGIGSRHSPNQV